MMGFLTPNISSIQSMVLSSLGAALQRAPFVANWYEKPNQLYSFIQDMPTVHIHSASGGAEHTYQIGVVLRSNPSRYWSARWMATCQNFHS